MSQNSATESELGELHRKIAKKYTYLIDNYNIQVHTGIIGKDNKEIIGPLMTIKELIATLNGGTKFLNDNDIKAVSYIEEISELEKSLKDNKTRDFGKVVSIGL